MDIREKEDITKEKNRLIACIIGILAEEGEITPEEQIRVMEQLREGKTDGKKSCSNI